MIHLADSSANFNSLDELRDVLIDMVIVRDMPQRPEALFELFRSFMQRISLPPATPWGKSLFFHWAAEDSEHRLVTNNMPGATSLALTLATAEGWDAMMNLGSTSGDAWTTRSPTVDGRNPKQPPGML